MMDAVNAYDMYVSTDCPSLQDLLIVFMRRATIVLVCPQHLGTTVTTEYDLLAWSRVEYKLHGSDGLLNYDLSEDEAAELKKTDWDSLISKLGLNTNELRRKPRKLAVSLSCKKVSVNCFGGYTYAFSGLLLLWTGSDHGICNPECFQILRELSSAEIAYLV